MTNQRFSMRVGAGAVTMPTVMARDHASAVVGHRVIDPGESLMSRGTRVGLAAVGCVALFAVSACGSGSGSDAAPDTTTPPPVDSTTTTTLPATMEAALESRLTDEFGDPATAREVMAGVDQETLDSLGDRVTIEEVATTPLLDYTPDRTPDDQIDSLVVFDFAYRDDGAGGRIPSPANQEMATAVETFVADHPVPVFAQTSAAGLLIAANVPNVVSLDADVGPDGQLVYLSTAGAADKAVAQAAAMNTAMGTVGVVAFSDHLGRSVLTAEAAGMDATVAESMQMPSTYDAQSAQPWTARSGHLPAHRSPGPSRHPLISGGREGGRG